MRSDVQVITVDTSCKKCGERFSYVRLGNLKGAPRTVCDKCRLDPQRVDLRVLALRALSEKEDAPK